MMTVEQNTNEMKDIFQRFFRMRHSMRLGLPKNIEDLKIRLHQIASGSPAENSNYFELFFNVGNVLTRQAEPMAMGNLSRSLNVPLSSATRIVDWLVSNNFAQRLPDPDDRRVVLVVLTEDGLALYREIDSFFTERMEGMLRGFTLEERSTFRDLLLKIITNMEQEA